jgi:hypothetical protein
MNLRALAALFFCLSAAAGARTVSVKQLLLSSFNEPEVVEQEKSVRFLQKPSLTVPFLKKIELRVRNTAAEEERMRYELRVSPRGIGETMRGAELDRATLRNNSAKSRMILNRAMKDRYGMAIDFAKQRALRPAYDTLMLLIADKIKVLESRSYNPNFNLTDILVAENEYTKAVEQKTEIEKSAALDAFKAADFMADSSVSSIDTNGFVAIDTVMEYIGKTSFSLDTNNVYLAFFREEYQCAEAMYNLEKSEGRRYLSYVQLSYNNGTMWDEMTKRLDEKAYELNKAYALECAFDIPNLTIARRDINKRELSYLSEKAKYKRLKRDLGEKMTKDLADIKAFIGQYRFMKSRESDVNATASLKKYLQMSGIDPLVLVTTKESIVRNRIAMIKLTFDILWNFIEVEDVVGVLSQRPLVNILSADKETVSP